MKFSTLLLVRIVAIVLVIASGILYFTAREYAFYPAIAGFAIIALINLPLNIWLAMKRERMKKEHLRKFDQQEKDDR